MSMLAEPRRKQRIGPNPRGKFYAEEKNNVGKELLEKMGWSNGDGLGVGRKGIKEAIKPKIQMSSKGLGYDPKANPWVEHNVEFEEILKNLNQIKQEDMELEPVEVKVEDVNENEDDMKQKLERKSKKSRARIHYHKFVKGKDLSRASSEDLKSIFGNSVSEDPVKIKVEKDDTPSMTSSSDNQGDVDKESSECNEEKIKTINKGSMIDYFKKKMEEKKLKSVPTNEETALVEDKDSKEEDEGNTINRGSMVDYFKQKMEEKRLKTLALELEKVQAIKLEPLEQSDEITNEDAVKSNKKKKRKKVKCEEGVEIDVDQGELPALSLSPAVVAEDIDPELVVTKPKKKKKRKIQEENFEESEVGSIKSEEVFIPPPPEAKPDSSEVVVEKSKKKKKRKIENDDEDNTVETQILPPSEEVLQSQPLDFEQPDSSEVVVEKSMKKKKKRKKENDVEEIADEGKIVEEPQMLPPEEALQSQPLDLEQRLKLEMENLKHSKQRKKDVYFSSLPEISKKFKGSNIEKVKGYMHY